MEDYTYANSETGAWKANRKKEKISKGVINRGVTSISTLAFFNCTTLSEISIPDTVTSIKGMAFCACFALDNITIPKSVTSIENGAFQESYLSSINVEADNTMYFSDNGILFNKAQDTLIAYPPERRDESYAIPDHVTTIAECGFYGCWPLKEIIIPEGVISIGRSAFYNCSWLHSITIPASVTHIGDWVVGFCYLMTDIIVDPSNEVYSSADGILYNKDKSVLLACTTDKSDETYVFSPTVTGIGNAAFVNNKHIVNAFIPENISSIGDHAFSGCHELKNVIIPDTVTSFGKDVFGLDENVTLSVFPGSSAENYAIANNIPYQVLDVLFLPDDLKTIGTEAFRGSACDAVIIPDGCTTIDAGAFANCPNLVYVSIPSDITTIDPDAFQGSDRAVLVYR